MMMNIINFNISKTLQVIGGRKRKSSELLACLPTGRPVCVRTRTGRIFNGLAKN